MTDIQTWLDEGRALADNATDGPWVARPDHPTMAGETWSLRVAGKPGLRASVVEYQYGPGNMEFIVGARTRYPQALNAIQAVLDLHKKRHPSPQMWRIAPDSNEPQPVTTPETCDYCRRDYPCPTVRAIQTVIKGQDT